MGETTIKHFRIVKVYRGICTFSFLVMDIAKVFGNKNIQFQANNYLLKSTIET